MSQTPQTPEATLEPADVRDALAFNVAESDTTLATLRDVLLDTSPRTPEQALAAARILLAAHARERAEQARTLAQERGAEMRERGDRSRVAMCTGMNSVRRQLTAYADRLDEQPAT
ncbi:hypothetical protein ACOKM5_24335 [Streptomyces sp. BH097]|uniref:hypothetical protein n=1 Tax=Streptomyces sp. BH097 TaxID=3410406 RepID=UPI003CF107DD